MHRTRVIDAKLPPWMLPPMPLLLLLLLLLLLSLALLLLPTQPPLLPPLLLLLLLLLLSLTSLRPCSLLMAKRSCCRTCSKSAKVCLEARSAALLCCWTVPSCCFCRGCGTCRCCTAAN
jgi:hypothetical protein